MKPAIFSEEQQAEIRRLVRQELDAIAEAQADNHSYIRLHAGKPIAEGDTNSATPQPEQ